ncbi:hypothetical protein UFOVP1082_47 [uncultured Caudovirales phage]|uniref:Uncharacterized protein n=1 Tax=uncultured Caudovirales phage TaxID=2100421 RepID=A0A6J7X8N1_9CAUD|nr:hypothetical protein UFOVP906_25 [uncultured Caudovirales phage]CAB4176668.1 hypothetical protein UFOVP992_51 [uncultured Caudovirales phage]CAB4183442.1 hypothetical protein UFOVP1082_47 [uncultured Caudovirales phage]CAB4197619.1 hypothetical protein UFOVP1322_32 [uncultured Caudovirales phage]CAB4212961.1 hypothetical protein UFOVP1434_54 [uncultured Caudovirales phage]
MQNILVIRFSATFGTKLITSKFDKLSRIAGGTEEVNRKISISLYGWTIRNFNRKGSGVSESIPWAPLSPATIKRKAKLGKTQMLVISGNLRQSFNPFFDSKSAGVGAQASAFKGSSGDYALYLHEGTKNMPARNLLPTEQAAKNIAHDVYNVALSKIIDGN